MGDTLPSDDYDDYFDRGRSSGSERWRERPRPLPGYRKSLATIFIEDGAQRAPRTHDLLRRTAAALYEFCADARTPKEIAARFDDATGWRTALGDFVERDLMVHLDGRYLSLALPENPYI